LDRIDLQPAHQASAIALAFGLEPVPLGGATAAKWFVYRDLGRWIDHPCEGLPQPRAGKFE